MLTRRILTSRLLSLILVLGGATVRAQQAHPLRPITPTPPPHHRGITASQAQLKYRWVYCSHNLQVDSEVTDLEAIMERAAAAGYNGIVLSDYKLNILDMVAPWYMTNVAEIQAKAAQLHLDLIPCVFPIGDSGGLLAHNANLAEGFPVQNAVFQVRNGQADIVPDSTIHLTNGNFEQSNSNIMTGWGYQDLPGTVTFADRVIKHSGTQSLRIQDPGIGNPASGNGRVIQQITVKPYRHVDYSVWIKTDQFTTPGNIWGLALDPNGMPVHYVLWGIQSTQDWTQYHAVFNTLNNTKLTFYLGVWGGGTGKLWFDDAGVQEVGLINLLRRPGCPLTVTSADGKTTYVEGQDFNAVADPLLSAQIVYGAYEVYHTPPTIQITSNSRIKAGQNLLVSYYHAETYNDGPYTDPYNMGSAACCLTDPGVYALLQDQLTRVQNLLNPPGFFMSHDELREVNWCAECQGQAETPGQLLANNVSQCIQMIKGLPNRPAATAFVWSDMFDPYHNAHAGYYLDNGDLSGSWNGLTRDTVIVNWNTDNVESMAFFTGRGNPQILAGYYDGDPNEIRTWLQDAKNQSVVGVMYTTWADNYSDLETFAQAAWGP